jgi:glycosyltransferase involved in cell wall biosynthesis
LAKELGIASRVRFIGRVQQEELRFHYSAADLSVLASSSEGWPNVLLESMACGTAVVASRVGGIPEVVAAPSVGCLFESGSVASLATAIREMAALTRDPERRALVRQYACGLGWDETSAGQLSLFAELVQGKTDA